MTLQLRHSIAFLVGVVAALITAAMLLTPTTAEAAPKPKPTTTPTVQITDAPGSHVIIVKDDGSLSTFGPADPR